MPEKSAWSLNGVVMPSACNVAPSGTAVSMSNVGMAQRDEGGRQLREQGRRVGQRVADRDHEAEVAERRSRQLDCLPAVALGERQLAAGVHHLGG